MINGKKSLLVSVLLIMVMVAIAIVPALAQESTPEPSAAQPVLTASTGLFVTSEFVVNARSGPGTEYTILDKLRPGSSVDITGRLADSTWIRLNWSGVEAWVSASVVDVTGDLSTAPEAAAGATAVLRSPSPESPAAATSGDVVVIARFNTNLRATPAVEAERVAVIPFNTQLAVDARNADGTWVQVTYDGQMGWIMASLLFFSQGTVDSLTALDAQGNVVIITTATPDASDSSSSAVPEATP